MNKNAIVLWLMGGAGVLLLYCAIKNVSPTSLITSYYAGTTPKPLASSANTSSGTVATTAATVSGGGSALVINPNGTTSPLPGVYTPNTYVGTVLT